MLSWLLAIFYCLMLIAPTAAISADDMLHRLGINVEGRAALLGVIVAIIPIP